MKWFKKSGFVCGVCGQSHEGLLQAYGYQLPDVVWTEPVEVRQALLDWSTDICFYRERWFLRGVLEVPFQFQAGEFGWGVWAEVGEETMARFHAYYEGGAPRGAREPGIVANAIPAHLDSVGLPVELEFGPLDKRPLFFMAEGNDHPLAIEQRAGITAERYHEILGLLR